MSEAGVCVHFCGAPVEQSCTSRPWCRSAEEVVLRKLRLGTKRGDRQACKLGPDISNAAHATALQDVVEDIPEARSVCVLLASERTGFLVCWCCETDTSRVSPSK